MLQTALELLGVFAFALSGGARGVERRLDMFGVVFLAFVAATSGGVLRDVVIGATPPVAFSDWRYLAVSAAAGLFCYFAYEWIDRIAAPVALFDAVGLGLSAVVGAQKALEHGLTPAMAAVIGMLSAIGGGMARDILTVRTPMVLRRDIYALAALAGAAVAAFGGKGGAGGEISALSGATLVIAIRLAALWRKWHLPVALGSRSRAVEDDG